jgi:AcrR family transcriptional regulator
MGVRERKQREKDLRREQIQNAAKHLFIKKSYSSTTIEEIAQQAELSPATIYNYFKNKEELYISLNLISLQYLLDEVTKIDKNKRIAIEKKILKFKDAMYNTFKYDPLILRNIFHAQIEDTLLTISNELLKEINSLSKQIFAIMASVYEEGVREGIFIENHPIAVADSIWGLFTGLLIWEESKRKLNPQKNFLRSTLDTAFEIFYRGIRKSED